jgi:tetratricopeptide (TPR) repeat protein
MKTAWAWVIRALVLSVCVFLTARTARIAVADLRAQQHGLQGVESAIRLEPGDSVLVARAALFRNDIGDVSPEVDRQLRHASEEDPLNADVLMALGLREEFAGHPAEAERYLVHAAAIDHTFKPAWTLANFYFRNNQPDKSWPMIGRIVNLDPLAVDPSPVFDLCWYETGDAKKIQALIPAHGVLPLQYLGYLMTRKQVDAAIELLPRVLDAADPADLGWVDSLNNFVEFLERANRLPDAVRSWNQLADRKIIVSGRLDPGAGVSVADPDFTFPLIERGFGWRVAHEAGVSVVKESSSLRFEFDGNEPESSVLLTTAAPLVPGRAYRLIWKTDASSLSSRQDPGFAWRIVQQPGDAVTECQPLLQAGDEGACRFTSLSNANKAQLNLMYRRAVGTTRVEGMLRIANVKLEFGS